MKIFMVLDHSVDYLTNKGPVARASARSSARSSAYLPVTFGKVKDNAEIQLG